MFCFFCHFFFAAKLPTSHSLLWVWRKQKKSTSPPLLRYTGKKFLVHKYNSVCRHFPGLSLIEWWIYAPCIYFKKKCQTISSVFFFFDRTSSWSTTVKMATVMRMRLLTWWTWDRYFCLLYSLIYIYIYTGYSDRTEFCIFSVFVLCQACRTPSRNEEGVELLAKYFSHLPLIESRFFSPNHQPGIFFTWYDSI